MPILFQTGFKTLRVTRVTLSNLKTIFVNCFLLQTVLSQTWLPETSPVCKINIYNSWYLLYFLLMYSVCSSFYICRLVTFSVNIRWYQYFEHYLDVDLEAGCQQLTFVVHYGQGHITLLYVSCDVWFNRYIINIWRLGL